MTIVKCDVLGCKHNTAEVVDCNGEESTKVAVGKSGCSAENVYWKYENTVVGLALLRCQQYEFIEKRALPYLEEK